MRLEMSNFGWKKCPFVSIFNTHVFTFDIGQLMTDSKISNDVAILYMKNTSTYE